MHPGVNSRVKRTLKIGEVAKRAAVAVDTVRFYERQGLLPLERRSHANYRLFSETAVERIAFIKQAQAIGFGLGEVKKILLAIDADKLDYVRGRARLLAVAERVDEKIASLKAVRKKLSAMIKQFEAGHCEELEATARTIRRKGAAAKR